MAASINNQQKLNNFELMLTWLMNIK